MKTSDSDLFRAVVKFCSTNRIKMFIKEEVQSLIVIDNMVFNKNKSRTYQYKLTSITHLLKLFL